MSGQNREVIKLKLTVKIFTAIGSIILFGSWITESFFQQRWHSEVMKMEEKRLLIRSHEINKNLWWIFTKLEEKSSTNDTINKQNLNDAYSTYARYFLTLRYQAESSVSNAIEQNRIDSVFKNNWINVSELSKSNQIDKLEEFAKVLSKLDEDSTGTIVRKMKTKFAVLSDKELFWSKVYLALYIIGALPLVIAFLIDYRLTKFE